MANFIDFRQLSACDMIMAGYYCFAFLFFRGKQGFTFHVNHLSFLHSTLRLTCSLALSGFLQNTEDIAIIQYGNINYSKVVIDPQTEHSKGLKLYISLFYVFFLSHLLVAGCDIGIRFSIHPPVNIYVDVRHLGQS